MIRAAGRLAVFTGGSDLVPRIVLFSAANGSQVERVDRNARRKTHARRGGFTIFEVLLSLAIIGLIAAILISGSGALLQDKPVAVKDVFWQAVEAARKEALQSDREVRLRFFEDREKGKGFEIIGARATPFVLAPEVATNDLKVDFLTTQKGGNVILVAGVVVETQTVPFVTFFPDGTCTSFRVQILRNGGTEIVSIDPWTCAEMLTPPDPNAPVI
jgi:prepilin-type N-terminal cleavage/methylation domain-containing protein